MKNVIRIFIFLLLLNSILLAFSFVYGTPLGGSGTENYDFFHTIEFDLADTPSTKEGHLSWHTDEGTLNLGMPGGTVNLQIGQEHLIRVRNESGANILNGSIVYISGAQGIRPTIELGDADNPSTSMIIGWATEDIDNNDFGFVTTRGLLRQLNTSGCVAGDILWLSATAGDWEVTRPTAPACSVIVGVCLYSHATEGVVYATVSNFSNLSELSDVFINNLQNGQVLAWDSTDSRWENVTP